MGEGEVTEQASLPPWQATAQSRAGRATHHSVGRAHQGSAVNVGSRAVQPSDRLTQPSDLSVRAGILKVLLFFN